MEETEALVNDWRSMVMSTSEQEHRHKHDQLLLGKELGHFQKYRKAQEHELSFCLLQHPGQHELLPCTVIRGLGSAED